MRKKQERVRLWKEKKQAEEEAKKKLAIAAAEKEAEELKLKQEQQLELKKKQEAEEAQKQQQEEPQLLQQFAAMKKAAAEAAAKEEHEASEKQDEMDTTEDVSTQQAELEANGKKWSLEDDSESDDDADMDIDGSEAKKKEAQAEADKAAAEAERTFKPLQKMNHDEESKDDEVLAKPKKSFLMSNLSTKPKNTMRMGFGLGKQMTMKKTMAPVQKKEVELKPIPAEKEPVDTVMEDSEEIDPLEAYMIDVHAETKKINEEDKIRMDKLKEPSSKRRGSLMDDDDDIPDDTNNANNEEDIGSDPEDILA